MLSLSRKVNEKIVIGSEIVITVLEVKGRRVRLGIAAPSTVPIRRCELSVDRHDPDAGPAVGREQGELLQGRTG